MYWDEKDSRALNWSIIAALLVAVIMSCLTTQAADCRARIAVIDCHLRAAINSRPALPDDFHTQPSPRTDKDVGSQGLCRCQPSCPCPVTSAAVTPFVTPQDRVSSVTAPRPITFYTSDYCGPCSAEKLALQQSRLKDRVQIVTRNEGAGFHRVGDATYTVPNFPSFMWTDSAGTVRFARTVADLERWFR